MRPTPKRSLENFAAKMYLGDCREQFQRQTVAAVVRRSLEEKVLQTLASQFQNVCVPGLPPPPPPSYRAGWFLEERITTTMKSLHWAPRQP